MSSKDFLDQMNEAGKEYSEEIAFLTVAKMRLQFGYSGFVSGERPANFFKPFGDPKDNERVSAEVSARLAEVGSKRGAVLAILLSVPESNNTGEKVTWDIEQVTFVSDNKDSEYQILFNALRDGEFPVNEWFWGSYKNEVVGEYEKDGETKKRYLSIPVEKYANEAAAKAAAGSGSSSASADSQWSDKVRSQFKPPSDFENQANDIHAWLKKVQAGEEMAGYPLESYKDENDKVNIVQAKRYVANCWGVETADIDLLPSPF